jgi:hypothetical protein
MHKTLIRATLEPGPVAMRHVRNVHGEMIVTLIFTPLAPRDWAVETMFDDDLPTQTYATSSLVQALDCFEQVGMGELLEHVHIQSPTVSVVESDG